MPSKSPAQARLMQAVAHNPQFAARVGIPTAVGQEFNDSDLQQPKSTPNVGPLVQQLRRDQRSKR